MKQRKNCWVQQWPPSENEATNLVSNKRCAARQCLQSFNCLGWVHLSDISSGGIAARHSGPKKLVSKCTHENCGSDVAQYRRLPLGSASALRQFAVERHRSTCIQMGLCTRAVGCLSSSATLISIRLWFLYLCGWWILWWVWHYCTYIVIDAVKKQPYISNPALAEYYDKKSWKD